MNNTHNSIDIFRMMKVAFATSPSGVSKGLRCYIYNVVYHYAVIIIMY